MRNARHNAATLLVAFATFSSFYTFAQGFKSDKVSLVSGNWTVYRNINPMTDKVSCTGLYKNNPSIQLSQDNLYVKIQGGLESVTLRFGESPAQPLRLAQKIEKSLGAVDINGTEFSQALQNDRLRVQVLTLVRGVALEDMDLSGIKGAIDHIRNGCPTVGTIGPTPAPMPAPPPPKVAVAAVPPAAATNTPTAPMCPMPLLTRLRAAGVTEKQLEIACVTD